MASYKLSRILKSPIPFIYLPYTLLILGLLGFMDATYLTILHYKNVIPPCTLSGCETVLSSKFAELIPGIPTSLIGIGFYAVIMVLAGIFITYSSSTVISRNEVTRDLNSEISHSVRNDKLALTISYMLFAICSAGLVVGLFLIGIQAFILHAYCQYCLLSELIDFLLFDASWWLYSGE